MKHSKDQNKIALGNGVTLKAKPVFSGCTGCYFDKQPYHCMEAKCEEDVRNDGLDVIFVRVEK